MLIVGAFADEIDIPDEIDDDELDEDEEILRLLEQNRIVSRDRNSEGNLWRNDENI